MSNGEGARQLIVAKWSLRRRAGQRLDLVHQTPTVSFLQALSVILRAPLTFDVGGSPCTIARYGLPLFPPLGVTAWRPVHEQLLFSSA